LNENGTEQGAPVTWNLAINAAMGHLPWSNGYGENKTQPVQIILWPTPGLKPVPGSPVGNGQCPMAGRTLASKQH